MKPPPPPPLSASASAWTRSKPPLLRFLNGCHDKFAAETAGEVADYIPELGKADPAHFGISLATLDGHVYEVGDTSSLSDSRDRRSDLETNGIDERIFSNELLPCWQSRFFCFTFRLSPTGC